MVLGVAASLSPLPGNSVPSEYLSGDSSALNDLMKQKHASSRIGIRFSFSDKHYAVLLLMIAFI